MDALAWIGTLVLVAGLTGGFLWLVLDKFKFELRKADYGDETVAVDIPEPPPAAYQDDAGKTIRNPGWRFRPEIEYPREAMGVREGRVRMLCKTTVAGTLEDCTVVEEQPKGKGFGRAALAATDEASVYPRTVDGVASAGTITFSVPFKMAD